MLPISRLLPTCLTTVAICGAVCFGGVGLSAQNPAPAAETVDVPSERPLTWFERGSGLLLHEDPMGAWHAFRSVDATGPMAIDRAIGLGHAHLMLGHSEYSLGYGEHAVAAEPRRQDAMALTVRALIRARQFDGAVARSKAFVQRAGVLTADLLAARGSALFRVQRTSEAANAYRQVVALQAGNAEAHLRLGSGLLDPVEVEIPAALRLAVGALAVGERQRAIELLQRLLRTEPGHPIVHRLLGETLYAERTARSMAMQDSAFQTLLASLPKPATDRLPIGEFVHGYRRLARARRLVVERTCALFGAQLDKLVAVGGRHDLLHELERTTDAVARANLRGRRTFDGRVWDDVRGIGGMRAATGIEALDEAATLGFDTFAHEVAHQVHSYTFTPLQRARLRSLYRQAMAERRCLDYYAASNVAEYFGQGVEAFVSLAKRPGGETTHGHTRFELLRVDPALHAFIVTLVSFDPLAIAKGREPLLAACVAVAIRCGRPEDAIAAAQMMAPGEQRERLVAKAQQALHMHRCY